MYEFLKAELCNVIQSLESNNKNNLILYISFFPRIWSFVRKKIHLSYEEISE